MRIPFQIRRMRCRNGEGCLRRLVSLACGGGNSTRLGGPEQESGFKPLDCGVAVVSSAYQILMSNNKRLPDVPSFAISGVF